MKVRAPGLVGAQPIVDLLGHRVDAADCPIAQIADALACRIDIVGGTEQISPNIDTQAFTRTAQPTAEPIVDLDGDVGQHLKPHSRLPFVDAWHHPTGRASAAAL
jgi:hypothetical protein